MPNKPEGVNMEIREAFESDDLGDYVRERFPGIGDIELNISDIIELMQDVYKSRDTEIKKVTEALKDRTSFYYELNVTHQSQVPLCKCRKCIDNRTIDVLKYVREHEVKK